MYDYRRLKKAILQETGWIINHKKLLRVIRKYGLEVRYKKAYKHNYSKKCIEKNMKNRLQGDFKVNRKNERWTTDITYIIYERQAVYLSTILDLYNRDIVLYIISKRNDVKLVKDTLEQTLIKEKDVQGITLYLDQGFQYTFYEY